MPPLSVSVRHASARSILGVVLAVTVVLPSLLVVGGGSSAAVPSSSPSTRTPSSGSLRMASVAARAHVVTEGLRVVTRVHVDNTGPRDQPRTRAYLYLTQHGVRIYRLGRLPVPATDGHSTTRLRSVDRVRAKVAPGRYDVLACVEVAGRNSCAASRAAIRVGPVRLMLTPGSNDLGEVTVGQTSAHAHLVLTNHGVAGARRTRVVLDGPDRDQFTVVTDSCTGRTLAKDASCSVDVALRPTRPGPASAGITLTTSRGRARADLTGVGHTQQTAPAALAISPASPFPSTPVGSRSEPTVLAVTNTGGAASGTPVASVTGTGRDQFTIARSTCDGPLAAGASCLVTVRFDPTTRGAATATLSVTGAPGGTASTTLTGTALRTDGLTISPDLDAFSATLVGDVSDPVEVTVTNEGDVSTGPLAVSLAGPDADQFRVASSTCTEDLDPAESCVVSLGFGPTTKGTKDVRVVAAASPGGTTGTTLTGLALAPAALSISAAGGPFPTTLTGTRSDPVDLTVTNTGDVATGPLDAGLSGVDADQFAVSASTCAGPLAPGATCTVSVALAPTTRGAKTADVLVGGTPGGTTATTLTGSALAAAEVHVVQQPSFPDTTTLDHSAPLDYTFANGGDVSTRDLSVALTGDQAGQFTVVGTTCVGTLEPAGTCTVTITFDPTLRGWTDRALRIASLLVAEGDSPPATVGVYGYALPVPAKLVISPTSWTFDATAAGSTSPTQRFTVTNVGDLTTGLLRGATLSGPDWGMFTRMVDACYSSLWYRDTCYVDVSLRPYAGAYKGMKTASLDITASPGGTASAQLSGQVLNAGYPQPSVSSTSFGGVLVGDRSASTSITFTNTGDVPTKALATTLTGTDPTQYAIDQDGCTGVVLDPGAACTVSTYFAPTSRGSKRANLGVSTTALSVQMLGSGLAPTNLVLSPVTTAFPTTPVGQVSAGLAVTVTNIGDVASGIVTTTLGGADADQFKQTASTCTVPLSGGRSCKITYVFAPTTAGTKDVTVSASGGPAASTVSLMGSTG